ncbi:hypothetical protein SAMN05216582_1061 [Selenomonas ruminantium]|uniref:Uncharacterized protein n=1 Tax=Selenomonas ruminantium TaxID=971 RepID=A0A1M6T0G7_SELRU|nr:hypothetical protein [Selenomonas ruminantium]SHK50482.1 hypothetical protein SAMN05216582_1061 [Selenomonas ruminantium]
MKQSKRVWGIIFFMGMMLLGNWGEAAEAVSTVDSQELFRSQLVKDDKAEDKAKQAAQAVDKAVDDLPQLNSRFRWAAVKSSAELEEKQRVQERQKKAIPIIITAADIDREKKARKRSGKPDAPSMISPRPLEMPQIKPAPPKTAPKPVVPTPPQRQQVSEPQPLPADTIELPPVMPVTVQNEGTEGHPREIVELPPVEPVASGEQDVMTQALAEVMTAELVVDDIAEDREELPPVQPV